MVNDKPLTVFVSVGDGKTVIVTISKLSTISDLKSLVELEVKGISPELVKGVVTSNGKQWPDTTVLGKLDGAQRGVLKVSLSTSLPGSAASRKEIKVTKSRDSSGNSTLCHTCRRATTNQCISCGKHLCPSCLQFDGEDPTKRKVKFAEGTAINMECPQCAQSAKSPLALVNNHWKTNGCCIIVVFAFIIAIIVFLLVKPRFPSV
ncbi:hypothetical protein BCR33DRAFT_716345 [Rhizoclosmatium globosum]|uniref:Ubiquitin-like domain-containing protein n=1 Tax=Rhizoclosmatium globosum TaxID=329046 RepID=A0A1Y2CF83_9FUNG|nr:hypothetical protein BCR33DRAFT_716345 [Rhizoclosmatium globosum]|eukprot:ORY45710.1 hypothetical protein BCR33DRAFT_716345 [Rhizoclosmatium globosum]